VALVNGVIFAKLSPQLQVKLSLKASSLYIPSFSSQHKVAYRKSASKVVGSGLKVAVGVMERGSVPLHYVVTPTYIGPELGCDNTEQPWIFHSPTQHQLKSGLIGWTNHPTPPNTTPPHLPENF
jgi:hypothetical protein